MKEYSDCGTLFVKVGLDQQGKFASPAKINVKRAFYFEKSNSITILN